MKCISTMCNGFKITYSLYTLLSKSLTLTLQTSPYWTFSILQYIEIQTTSAVLCAWKSNCACNEVDQFVCISRAVSCTVRSEKYSAGWVMQSALKNNGRRSAHPLPRPCRVHSLCTLLPLCTGRNVFQSGFKSLLSSSMHILERVGLHNETKSLFF